MNPAAESTSPAVSVVMPVRNGAQFIAESINSVVAQTLTDWELIVVENGSTDETADIVADFAATDSRIRLIQAGAVGLVESLNVGLREARGHYIARMDADDVALPARLQRQADELDTHVDCVLVGTGYLYVDVAGEPIRQRRVVASDQHIRAEFHFGNPIGHPTAMWAPRRISEPVLYSAAYPDAEDFELWLRLKDHGALRNIAEPLLHHRIHPNAVTQVDTGLNRASAIRALDDHLSWADAQGLHLATFNPPATATLGEVARATLRLNLKNARQPVSGKGALAWRSAVAIARAARSRRRLRRTR